MTEHFQTTASLDEDAFDQSQVLGTQLVDEIPDCETRSPMREVEADPAIWGRLSSALFGTMYLKQKEYTFGRKKKQSDIYIADSTVSQVHCKLVFDQNAAYITDCGSSNGTFVNGSRQRISKDCRVRLRPGDSFSLVLPEIYHPPANAVEGDDEKQQVQMNLIGGSKIGKLENGIKGKSDRKQPFTFLFQGVFHENPFEGPIREKYEPIGEIGKGTYATVWKARHKTTGEDVAIKIVYRKQFQLSGQDKWENQRLEATTLSKFDHPNIIKLYETYEGLDALYMVVELVCGGELFDRLVSTAKPYTERDARDLARNILDGLAYIHEKGVLHRDLKPENILLCYKESNVDIKLADFGVAKEERGGRATLCGTLCYLAPEIMNRAATSDTYTKAVDIWSLGVVLYIVFTLHPPFEDDADRSNLDEAMKEMLKFEEREWALVSAQAKDFLSHLLELDPNKRYTAEQALKHPWIAGPESQNTGVPETPIQSKARDGDVSTPGVSPPLGDCASAASSTPMRLRYRPSVPPEVLSSASKRVKIMGSSDTAGG